MFITFVNLHGLPIRIARVRSNVPASVNDLTRVSADVISKLILFSQTHRVQKESDEALTN
ncbi:MAG: hypothetical protein ACLP51_00375 [Syntrophobacteraceae bacterium]